MHETVTAEAKSADPRKAQFESLTAIIKSDGGDKAAALAKVEDMATQGYVPAMRIAGKLYHKGDIVAADPVKAAAYVHQAAKGGDRNSAYDLWRTASKSGDKNNNEALEWLKQAAENGHPKANLKIGNFYAKGSNGFKKDTAKAMKHFQRAAKRNPKALMALAKIYMADNDMKHAVKYLEQALVAGVANAGYILGRIYGRGRGVERSTGKMMELYARAAEGGSVRAQVALADLAVRRGKLKTAAATLRGWLETSATKGDSDAMEALASCYYYGLGEDKPDPQTARTWYERAAAQGNETAEVMLKRLG